MKPEQAERLFIEGLFQESIDAKKIKVQAISNIEKLTGDASTRRYYRVTCPASCYVVCLGDSAAETDSDFTLIQQILETNYVRVPIIYDINLTKGYILEEDLGDQTLLSKLAGIDSCDDEYDLYKKAVDNLIQIHQVDYKNFSDAPFSNRSFDSEKLLFEINFTKKYFLEGFIGIELKKEDEQLLEESFKDICSKLEKQKRVVTHRDYHSRNIMVVDETQVIIDFQDARMGIPQYDMVSLLEDCYYELCSENVEKLKKHYWEEFLAPQKIQKDYEEFVYFYDLMAIQRIYKALGSFAYIYNLRSDRRYLKYIGYGFENLKRFLLKYSEYNDLRKLLSRIYYEY
jgi:aminoglycoside/choline kinase family phosphotransferase